MLIPRREAGHSLTFPLPCLWPSLTPAALGGFGHLPPSPCSAGDLILQPHHHALLPQCPPSCPVPQFSQAAQ